MDRLKMLTVKEAYKVVTESVASLIKMQQSAYSIKLPAHADLGTPVPFSSSLLLGKILLEDIYSNEDAPPFSRSLFDGVAIHQQLADHLFSCAQSTATIPDTEMVLTVVGMQPAGAPPLDFVDPMHCIEIATGAVVPNGSAMVIPYEAFKHFTRIPTSASAATITVENFLRQHQRIGGNIAAKGSDYLAGAQLLRKGTCLNSAQLGILASSGVQDVLVRSMPKVVLISTGDELMLSAPTLAAAPAPAFPRIRPSNAYALGGELLAHGVTDIEWLHFPDDLRTIVNGLTDLLDQKKTTWVVLVGGVSKGRFDFVPQALRELGVEILFSGVSQRPGKPLLYGVHRQKAVFFWGLPGNPISAL
ncbi:MAG: molybdopterin molybdotransferase MoeA, partial [Oligoflexia bacterium]|nr:molybdopterin molybdotransferase MoeA [Oligoflexia bacterium]